MWELDHKEGWVLKNWCFWTIVVEKTLERSLDRKEIKPVHPKGSQPWIFLVRTGAEAKAPGLWPIDVTSWKRPWCWNRLRARGEGGNRVWDGWMASLMQWTWAWANSGRQWRTGKPGMLQSMGSQRLGHNLLTGQQQIVFYTSVWFCLLILIKHRVTSIQSPQFEVWTLLSLSPLPPKSCGIYFEVFFELFPSVHHNPSSDSHYSCLKQS